MIAADEGIKGYCLVIQRLKKVIASRLLRILACGY
jgi:hypothetical protein